MSFQKKVTGFTLIELMVVLALVAIVATIALPSFSNLIANNQVRSATNNVIGFLNYSRAEAVKQGRRVRMGPLVGTNWDSGLALWIDGDNNDTFDAADTEIRRIDTIASSITLDSSSTAIGFCANGYVIPCTPPTSAQGAEFFISICSSNAGDGREVFVGFSGRTRTAARTCP